MQIAARLLSLLTGVALGTWRIPNEFYGTTITKYDTLGTRDYPVILEGPAPAIRGSSNLRDANVESADLRGTDLARADLRGTDLRGTDLSGTNLEGANLIGANLESAFLYCANLTGANLTGAKLEGAKLEGVTGSNTTCPDGSIYGNSDLEF